MGGWVWCGAACSPIPSSQLPLLLLLDVARPAGRWLLGGGRPGCCRLLACGTGRAAATHALSSCPPSLLPLIVGLWDGCTDSGAGCRTSAVVAHHLVSWCRCRNWPPVAAIAATAAAASCCRCRKLLPLPPLPPMDQVSSWEGACVSCWPAPCPPSLPMQAGAAAAQHVALPQLDCKGGA